MRLISQFMLALVIVAVTQSRASAFVRVDIDLSSQTMHVRTGSGESYLWPVSSGMSGHLTPRGVFRPRALYTMVHSAKYGNAPMPHSIFFDGQYAIHGTTAVGHLGRPASHGCVRLSPEAAAILFAMVQSQGAVIYIVGSPQTVAHPHHHRSHGSEYEWAHQGQEPDDGALDYAPDDWTPMLNQWTRDPLAR
jgi:hypothetical protein